MATGMTGSRLLSERLLGGAAVVLVSAVALVAASGLDSGTFAEIGPGLIPRVLAALLLMLGVAVSVSAFFVKEAGPGEGLFSWSPRAVFFILGAVVLFGLTVRLIGLTAAAPLAILTAGLASTETKWPELAAFALVLTAFCTLLFRYVLSLPIPVAPWLIGY